MRLIDADALIEFCAERRIPLFIDAVNMQPTIQPVATDTKVGNSSEIPNSSDSISRQAAINMCRKPHMRNADCSDFEMEIMMLPSAQPERKKGKWILGEIEKGAFNVQYQWERCSECGWESSLVIPRNYCPNCGADMRGEQDETD